MSTLNILGFMQIFHITQKFIGILNVEPKILSVPKKLSILISNFEEADGLGICDQNSFGRSKIVLV